MDHRALLLTSVVVLGGCEVLREIGSQCVDGLCDAAQTNIAPDCVVTDLRKRLIDDLDQGVLCNTRYQPDEQGLVPCEIFWSAVDPLRPPPELSHCAGFLHPAVSDERGSPRCSVQQVPAPEGRPAEAQGGFYFLQALDDEGPCRAGFRYTQGVKLPQGARADLRCTYAHALGAGSEAQAVPVEQCARPAAALALDESVGLACTPAPIPPGGFHYEERSLDTAVNGCSGGPCLIYRLDGSPAADCSAGPGAAQCADPESVAARVYCSCRCDLPAGQAGPRCTCPSGFSCVPAFDTGPFAGSYCTLTESIVSEP